MNFIAELATTNLRIAVGLLEAFGYVVFCLTAAWLGRAPSVDILVTVGGFILVQQGLDVTQFIAKRATYAPEVHSSATTRRRSTTEAAGLRRGLTDAQRPSLYRTERRQGLRL
jgi:hypothetical protein